MQFIKEVYGIYRLKIPFEELYTSVFLIQTENNFILFDSGSNANDVDNYIVPALQKILPAKSQLNAVIITHNHQDHAGGLSRLLEIYPHLTVITGVQTISDELNVYAVPGHLNSCIGLLDLRSGTLLSGDGLQGHGVGKYRCSLESKENYLNTIEKIEKEPRIENILFSHAYEPWYQDGVFGREQVLQCLQDCKKYI